MAKRGPGKFDSDLDAAIYSLSLDGGPDEQAGDSSEGAGWYGLMRDGADLAKAIKDRQSFAPEEVAGVSAADLEFLCTDGKAGAIMFEGTHGGVEVTYYDSKSDLDKDWAEVEEANSDDDEEYEGNRGRRRNAKLSDVSSRYGAPMGRPSENVEGQVTLEPVRIDSGGYDSGGAYWGSGQPLWRAQDEDGSEKFFRAADRAAAKKKLESEGSTVVAGSSERQDHGAESKLETDGTLAEFLDRAAESSDMSSADRKKLEVTPELSRAAVEYEAALWEALSELVKKYPPEGGADANILFEDGDAPYNVYASLAGFGVGINDGRWDEYYDSDVIREKVVPFLEKRLGDYVSEYGGGKLVDALDNAVYEQSGEGGEREENKRHRNGPGQARFNVTLGKDHVDVVYFSDDMTADDVKRSLVDHDGYDDRITVKKMERRRTGVPAAAYLENSGGFKTIADLKAANAEAGMHFFDRGNMRFARSKIESKLYGGRYFVTSEQMGDDSPRRYTVREAMPDASIKTIGEYQGFRHVEDARDRARDLLKPRAPNPRRIAAER